MRTIFLIAGSTWKASFRNKATLVLTLILGLALCLAMYIGWQNFNIQNGQRLKYKQIVRQQWLAKPDKHPHRMAHYGYLAFRDKHELSFFDFGIESFAGVSIFLEAHKQNTVNFSEAGFSNGMLRFGEMSVAMVLQLLVPLLIFFLGYNSISAERENGTLKILLCQGVSWPALLTGKIAGIIAVSFTLFIPVILLTIFLWAMLSHWQVTADATIRLLLLVLAYAVYFIICAGIAVVVSAVHKTSRAALTTLLACWVFFTIVMPRITQAIGVKVYPSPSKIEFAAAVESDLHQQGDSHNPDDPHYAKFRADVLKQYGVSDVKQLPFNYGGYVMAEGERISAGIYTRHQKALTKTFEQQNSFQVAVGYLNPFLAIKNLSMALTASDFNTFADFQDQAEVYRYGLAQRMNKLQKDKISNTTPGEKDKPLTISRAHWAEQADFKYVFKPVDQVMSHHISTIISLLCWLAALLGCLLLSSKWVRTL
ncbi:ABC-2 type transport system permease protein [Chitinophaga sp. W3I9]|uniref:ABC transporter permease n=1 Tax=Chitinophaga sp. W3I9 TaxID=3373924 RepID=UPI003D1E80B5